MADVSITAANVAAGSGAKTLQGLLGAAGSAGQLVYRDSTDNKYKLADADADASSKVAGILLNDGAANQPAEIQTEGEVDLGGGLTVGQVYVASTNAGGIAPYSDLLSGDFVSLVGVAITASKLRLGILNSGIAKP